MSKEKTAAMHILGIGVTAAALIIRSIASTTVSKPGCPDSCGNVSIPYPFGIGPGCFLPGFNLTCNVSYSPPKLTLGYGSIDVLSISLPQGEVRINGNKFTYPNIGPAGESEQLYSSWRGLMEGGPYTFSVTRNWFLGVGCNVNTGLTDTRDNQYVSFCGSICKSSSRGKFGCAGLGCCQSSISAAIKNFDVRVQFFKESTHWSQGGGFIVAKDYTFTADNTLPLEINVIPATLDWTVGSASCKDVKNKSGSACRSENSVCRDAAENAGYRCICSPGFEGNPYLIGGCKDINECIDPQKYECYGTCINTPGTYHCFCPHGTHGNAKIGCYSSRKYSVSTGVFIGVGIGIGAILLLLVIALLIRMLKTRRARMLKENYFRQNKGFLLQQLISSNKDAAETMKIFTHEELEKATNDFDRTRILGQGGHGTVYKGILSDQRVVAIKRSKINIQREIDQFINEVAILSLINHRNVVKLFGCCLETQVPLLVFEFISNGTLSEHLHVRNRPWLSWEVRLRIAVEAARALAYLHTAASVSVFHRDVKCANILLDDGLTAKISDFGASRSVPLDHTHITTAVEGTFGYLDPEYHHTGQLTDKSDVYSFGVILVELLTGQKAVSVSILGERRNLAAHFISSMRDNCLSEVLDARIVEEGGGVELESVTKLAEMCLRLRGEERPTMKVVEMTLEALRPSERQPLYTRDSQRPLLPSKRSNETTRSYSLEKELQVSANFPR